MDSNKTPNVDYAPVQQAQGGRNAWEPGCVRRFPFIGVVGLGGTLAAIAASAGILVASNGKPLSDWTLQPTVYLAITSALISILVNMSLTQGVTVAWWRRALSADTSVGDLHRSWAFGSSFAAAVLSGRHINLIAVACILTALVPVSGPLLQRASRVTTTTVTEGAQLRIQAGQEVPDGYTGLLGGRNMYVDGVTIYTDKFRQVVQAWNNVSTIGVPDVGCQGTCTTDLQGLGFAVNCSGYTIPYSINNTGNLTITQVFRTDVLWSAVRPNVISLGIIYKPDNTCAGNLQVRNCTLQSGAVNYPVLIDSKASTITLKPNTTIFDDNLDNVYNRTAIEDQYNPHTAIGGVALALYNRFTSILGVGWTTFGYYPSAVGNTALQYVNITDSQLRNCTLTFTDPTQDILAAARDLMFRTSLAAVNASTAVQELDGLQTVTTTIYRSHYDYLGGAVVLVLVAVLAIAATFHGYWHIGRKVTLSPVETAKAFGAPLLRGNDSNATAKSVLKEIGDKKVRYGAIAEGAGLAGRESISKAQDETEYNNGAAMALGEGKATLRFAAEGLASEPTRGRAY